MNKISPVSSSFKGSIDASLFLILIIIILLAPFYTHFWIERKAAYEIVPPAMGPYNTIAHNIFHQKGKIDVLFLGSSDMWVSICPEILRKDWKEKDGKDYNIFMIGSNWRGHDKLYFLLKDLVLNRSVRFVVLGIYSGGNKPHPVAKYLWNFYLHKNDFSSFDWRTWLSFYAESILGCPRLLLHPKPFSHSRLMGSLDGTNIASAGYDARTPGIPKKPFKKHQGLPPRLTSSQVIYKGEGEAYHYFNKPDHLSKFDDYFYKLIVNLCDRYKIKLVLLETPLLRAETPFREYKTAFLSQWSLRKDIPTISIPLNILFPRMNPDTIEEFYYNSTHMNSNGADYYTKAISNVLFELYHG